MSRFGVFNINGTEYDLDDLTLDEMEELEELAGGQPFSELNFGSAKTMKAVAFVLIKRTQPDLDFVDVGKVKVIDFAPANEEMPELPPDSEAASPNGSSLEDSGTPRSAASTTG